MLGFSPLYMLNSPKFARDLFYVDASLRWLQIAAEIHDVADFHRGRLQMNK